MDIELIRATFPVLVVPFGKVVPGFFPVQSLLQTIALMDHSRHTDASLALVAAKKVGAICLCFHRFASTRVGSRGRGRASGTSSDELPISVG